MAVEQTDEYVPGPIQIPANDLGVGSMSPSLVDDTYTPAQRDKALNDRYAKGAAQYDELGKKRDAAEAKRAEKAAPLEAGMESGRAAAQALNPPAPFEAEKFQHRGLTGEQQTELMQTMFAFAAIGGLMTRAPMTAAMNSWSGAMKGYMQGDKALFDRDSAEFDRNLKVALEKNRSAHQAYTDAFQKNRGNMQDLMNAWNLVNKEYQDTTGAINMERQDVSGMLKHIESLKNSDIRATTAAEKIKADRDALRDKLASNERIANQRDATARYKIDEAKKAGAGIGLKGKLLDSYVHNTANIDAIEEIIQALAANPDAVGFKEFVPGVILNRADPEGTPVRASIANINSMTIKDRAGTAQTAQEMRNIAPFIPRDGDDAQTKIVKLRGMQKEMRRLNDTAMSVTGQGGGGATPPVNAKGWKLHEDAQGNKAYVGPNNEIEPVVQ